MSSESTSIGCPKVLFDGSLTILFKVHAEPAKASAASEHETDHVDALLYQAQVKIPSTDSCGVQR